MNQFEIEGFLNSRGCTDISGILDELKKDSKVVAIDYKGYVTFRLK